jgi:hypothetical protein
MIATNLLIVPFPGCATARAIRAQDSVPSRF